MMRSGTIRAVAIRAAGLALGACILLEAAAAAQAGIAQAALDGAYADPKSGAQLPLSQPFHDDADKPRTLGQAIGDRPAVVVFADYTCATLCGPILAFVAAGLEQSGLTPGRDFHLIVIGIDAKDTIADARAMKASHVGQSTPLAAATIMLVGGADAVSAATAAAGYHAVYDAAADQFAHPAVAYVVTAQGRLSRTLSPLGLDAADLRLALVDAGQGRVGTVADHIRLLCYGFDPATGIYSVMISRIMLGAGIVTVAMLAAFVLMLALAARRRAPT